MYCETPWVGGRTATPPIQCWCGQLPSRFLRQTDLQHKSVAVFVESRSIGMAVVNTKVCKEWMTGSVLPKANANPFGNRHPWDIVEDNGWSSLFFHPYFGLFLG